MFSQVRNTLSQSFLLQPGQRVINQAYLAFGQAEDTLQFLLGNCELENTFKICSCEKNQQLLMTESLTLSWHTSRKKFQFRFDTQTPKIPRIHSQVIIRTHNYLSAVMNVSTENIFTLLIKVRNEMWAGKMTLIYCSLSPEELPADLSQHCNDHAEWKMDSH